jgi:glycosyltransferase involved in cell wall biosynthesis
MTARPRLHWVSPLPPAATDIAHYTGRILPALARVADVVLWTEAEDWAPWLEEHATVRRYDAGDPALDLTGLPGTAGPEIAVFQIGNSRVFHAGPVALARRMPGVVVLHDTGLQDLLLGLIDTGVLAEADYRAGMARWYGPRGARMADRVLARQTTPAQAVAAGCPGFELVAERATAALVHARGAFDEVRRRRMLPAYLLDLPYAPGPAPETARAAEGPLRLVQFGYIAPNRRLDQVLEALSDLRGALDFRLEVFGTVWDPAHVSAKIAELGLSDRVALRGFVGEAELDAALARAHLVFNLRHPTMGEASGSQLRLWNAGAAAVVSDAGWYRDLPEGTVLRVPAGEERAALGPLLRRIDADRGLCARIGAAGRARLESRHAPERYAEGLMALAAEAGRDAREALLAEAGRGVLAQLRRPGLPADRLAGLIDGEPQG